MHLRSLVPSAAKANWHNSAAKLTICVGLELLLVPFQKPRERNFEINHGDIGNWPGG